MSSQTYMSESESLRDLESRMMSPDREIYQSYKNLRVDAAFLGRILIVYKPTGLTADNQHREPEVLTQIKIVGFRADLKTGCVITLEDLSSGQVLEVSHIPVRLFHYDVFVGSPPFQRLRYDGRIENGAVRRSLAFGILIKTRTRSDWYSASATMVESPKNFRALYPAVSMPL